MANPNIPSFDDDWDARAGIVRTDPTDTVDQQAAEALAKRRQSDAPIIGHVANLGAEVEFDA